MLQPLLSFRISMGWGVGYVRWMEWGQRWGSSSDEVLWTAKLPQEHPVWLKFKVEKLWPRVACCHKEVKGFSHHCWRHSNHNWGPQWGDGRRASNRTGNNMDGLGDQTGNLDLVDSSFWLSGTGRMTSYGGASSLDTSFEEHLLTFPIAMA